MKQLDDLKTGARLFWEETMSIQSRFRHNEMGLYHFPLASLISMERWMNPWPRDRDRRTIAVRSGTGSAGTRSDSRPEPFALGSWDIQLPAGQHHQNLGR